MFRRALHILVPPVLGAIAAIAVPGPVAADGEAEALSARFRQAARGVLPAVVTVRAIGPTGPELAIAPFLPQPFEPPARYPDGSGVVIDAARGLVLTNDHVVRGAAKLAVTLHDGRERPVTRVRRDPRSDLALLTIAPEGLSEAHWGDSEGLDLGDWVLAIGQPFGLTDTVTAGIVSGKGRGLGTEAYEDLIQTDAAINPGNSGGPLVNLKGEIVGINTAIKTLRGGYEGIGFAVPARRARRVASDLAEFGAVRRSSIGILIGRLDAATAERIGQPGAVPVTGVASIGPAAEAGLRAGDVIVQVAGQPARGVGMLQATIEFAEIGKPLALRIVRDGRPIDLQIRPGPLAEPEGRPIAPDDPAARPPMPADAASPSPIGEAVESRAPSRFPELGLRLGELNESLARQLGLDETLKGLVVRGVEPESPADRGGLEIGMVLTDVAGRRVSSLADVREALAARDKGRDLVVRILKGKKPEFRVLLGVGGGPPAGAGR